MCERTCAPAMEACSEIEQARRFSSQREGEIERERYYWKRGRKKIEVIVENAALMYYHRSKKSYAGKFLGI